MSKLDHPILTKIEEIKKAYVEDLDPEIIPKDPEEFLTWWWDNNAKNCEDCILSVNRNSVVKPDGNTKARIMIIGEGPGFLEDLASIPMVGPLELRGSRCNLCSNIKDCFSQRILNKSYERTKAPKAVTCTPNYVGKHQLTNQFFLKSAGSVLDGIIMDNWKFNYPRNNWIQTYNLNHPEEPWEHESPWFITNAVLCRSTDVTKLKDQAPESLPLQKCRKWLTFQWAAVQPELIVCLGRIALTTLIGAQAAGRVAPNTFVETKYGKVLFQHHPAYYMREKNDNIKAYGFAKIASTFELALKEVGLPI